MEWKVQYLSFKCSYFKITSFLKRLYSSKVQKLIKCTQEQYSVTVCLWSSLFQQVLVWPLIQDVYQLLLDVSAFGSEAGAPAGGWGGRVHAGTQTGVQRSHEDAPVLHPSCCTQERSKMSSDIFKTSCISLLLQTLGRQNTVFMRQIFVFRLCNL